ncbi:MAG: hypothetical protein PHD30_06400 [Paludibacter sp.]|nr:hypothetical protein [Paludibacter sp.]
MFVLLSISCTAIAQTAPPVSMAGNLSVSNTIVDNDLKYGQLGPSVVVTYSAVRGNVIPSGTGNKAILGTTEYKDPVAYTKDEFSYYVSPVSDFMNTGNQNVPVYVPDKDINGNPRVYNGRIDIGAVEYSMIFNRGNGNWQSISKWNIERIPTVHDIVTVLNEVTVINTDAVCKSIILIGNNGKIIIDTLSQLDVNTTINNTNKDKIHIKASSSSPNGTLIFHNSYAAPVSATVEMYSMAYINENLPDDDLDKFNWQFFGIPMRTLSPLPPDPYSSWYVRWFREDSIGYDKWQSITANDMLTSFKGYEVVQPEEKIYTFKGILENKDTTIILNKSDVPYYAGQHLLANPYTASIRINDMVFGSNTEATVYLYHSGSYADWDVDPENGRLGTGRGQYLAVPQNVSEMILPSIPSMQGFIVRATANNGSVSIPYASATKNVSRQRIKKTAQINPHLTVELFNQHVLDRVWLIYEPTASKQFDNGWDGYKLINEGNAALIYANGPAGNLQVNTVDDFKEIYLHFVPGKKEFYKLKLINNNIEDVFSDLYLIDLQENRIVKIGSDTTIYTFSSASKDKNQNRFKITTQYDSKYKAEDQIKIFCVNDYRFIIQNLTDQDGYYALYDVSGRLFKQKELKAGSDTSFIIDHSSGVMILKAVAGSAQKTEKILIRK